MYDDCMLFAGALTHNGYARIGVRIDGIKKVRPLHREMYLSYVGPIEDGLVMDHLCRIRHCINPNHLEPVTNTENIRRGNHPGVYGTHCNNGHDLSIVGFRVESLGRKRCRECRRTKDRARYAAKRQLPTPS